MYTIFSRFERIVARPGQSASSGGTDQVGPFGSEDRDGVVCARTWPAYLRHSPASGEDCSNCRVSNLDFLA